MSLWTLILKFWLKIETVSLTQRGLIGSRDLEDVTDDFQASWQKVDVPPRLLQEIRDSQWFLWCDVTLRFKVTIWFVLKCFFSTAGCMEARRGERRLFFSPSCFLFDLNCCLFITWELLRIKVLQDNLYKFLHVFPSFWRVKPNVKHEK